MTPDEEWTGGYMQAIVEAVMSILEMLSEKDRNYVIRRVSTAEWRKK